MTSPVSRSFHRLSRPTDAEAGKLPPGQHVTTDFPVLSAGPTPHTPLQEWTFSIRQGGQTLRSWIWPEIQDMPAETATVDIHLPVKDVSRGQAWLAFDYDGQPLAPEYGGPARLLVPHLYFWKSAKWVRGLDLLDHDQPGFWENYGYNNYGDPWREQRYAGD
jgi:DMSO/TMAO reductase YedYZ molybdopterin-dependent catalytic subunit